MELWFGNQSTKAGVACIYQNQGNVSANVTPPSQLAWIVCGANPSIWVKFIWTLDYSLLWIDQGPPQSQQIEPADLQTSNSRVLSRNRFGYLFSSPSAGTPGSLSIKEDNSVPSTNQAIAGIGMSGAGTFAVAAKPNQTLLFEPAPASVYSYSITFGQYTFQEGDVLNTAVLNPSGFVKFPSGVVSMTAILDESNSWAISPEPPPKSLTRGSLVVYEVGKGIVG